MKKTSKVSRRSFVGLVTGAAASAVVASPAKAQSGITDSDSGPNSDSAGNGRGTGITDSDTGAYADQAGNGRGGRTSGLTDSDTGPNRDPAGNGRGNRTTGLTDSDTGPTAILPATAVAAARASPMLTVPMPQATGAGAPGLPIPTAPMWPVMAAVAAVAPA